VLSSNSSTIDTTTLGIPVGNWPSTQCNSTEFFDAQNLIFDITLCGGSCIILSASKVICPLIAIGFAGVPEIFSETCTGSCYKDHVVGDGSNYAQAYFEIASVRVFSKQANLDANSITSDSRGFEISMLGLGLSWITATLLLTV